MCRAGRAPCPGCAAPSRTRRRTRARGRSATTGMAVLRVRSPRGSLAATACASSSASRISTSAVRSNRRLARSIMRLTLAIASIQFAEEFAALLRLKREIKARLALEQQSLPPGARTVGPGFDRKQVAAGLRRRETAAPAVVSGKEHRLAPPIGLGFLPPQQLGGRAGRAPPGANRPIHQWLRRQCA